MDSAGKIKTLKELRSAFWMNHTEFVGDFVFKKTQNDYRTDVRVEFCEWVDNLRRNEIIDDNLAIRATL